MIRILGIDPSTNHVGICVMDINSVGFKIFNIETTTIELGNVETVNMFNPNQYYRLNILTNILTELIQFYKPNIVAYENPFIDRFRMSSAIPLGQSIECIEKATFDYNPNMVIARYSPHSVKKAVGTKKNKTKQPVLDAMNLVNEITKCLNPNIITEHEVDATAIAYATLHDIRKNPMIIY
jgi:Holliday junction resolvasome RuvABC endonuclease subunit